MYKFDIHCHCAEGSDCGRVPVRELVRAYAKAGFDGFVLTDHFTVSTIEKHGSWRAAVEHQWQAYQTACDEAAKCGITVLFGFEMRYLPIYDFLIYGLGPDFLLANPDLFTLDIEPLAQRIHAAGGFLVQPHPFRYLKKPIFIPVDQLDAIEIYNGSHADVNSPYPAFYNDLAEHFAGEMKLVGTAGSDTHGLTADGLPYRKAAMLFEDPVTDIGDIIRQIREQRFTIER